MCSMSITRKYFSKLNIFLCILLLISVAYLITYHFSLVETVQSNFEIRYLVIRNMIAMPLFYLSLSAIVSSFVLQWSEHSLKSNTRKICQIFTVVLLIVCLFSILNSLFVIIPTKITTIIASNPTIFMPVGVFLVLGWSKKEKNDNNV